MSRSHLMLAFTGTLTGYTAKVAASCSPSGPWVGKTKTFEFYRYKGNLDVKR